MTPRRRRELAAARAELLRGEPAAVAPRDAAPVPSRAADPLRSQLDAPRRARASRRDGSAGRNRTAGSSRRGIRRPRRRPGRGRACPHCRRDTRDATGAAPARAPRATSPSRPERGGFTICEPDVAAGRPPGADLRQPLRAAAAQNLRHAARCVRRRAPPHPRARPRAFAHLRRSTCAASRRARNRDRARSCPRLREDARRRPERPPVADAGSGCRKARGRERDPSSSRDSARPQSSRQPERANRRRPAARMQMQPQALDPGRLQILRTRRRAGAMATSRALTIRVACRPATCRIGERQRIAVGGRRRTRW